MTQKTNIKQDSSTNYLKYILIALIIIIAGYFVYNYFNDKNDNIHNNGNCCYCHHTDSVHIIQDRQEYQGL